MKSIEEIREAGRFAGLRGQELNSFIYRMVASQNTLREERAREAEEN